MSIGKDLIRYANKCEEFRKSLHCKNKISQHDCKECRLGMLTVLGALDFLTYEDEPIDIANKAGAWDKELKGEERVGYWTEHHINKRGYGAIEYLHKECDACGIELFKSPYDYCPNCGMKMLRKKSEDTE